MGVYMVWMCVCGTEWIQLRIGECITDLGWERLMSATPCRRCVASQQSSAEVFFLPPHDTLVCHPVRTRFLLLSLHGLFHLSWLASSFWVFSSTKWGECTVPGSRLSLSQGSLGIRGFAVSGGCKLLGRRLSGGWMGAGVGVWDSLMSYYIWKLINPAAGRCRRCREGCSVGFPCT